MENLKSKIGTLLIGIAFGLLLVVGFKCNEKDQNKHQSIDTVTVIKIKIDTFIKETEKIVFKDRFIPVNQPIKLQPKDIFNLAYLRVYRDSIVDTNVTINTLDSVQGKLLSKQTKYKLKIPVITKTIEITKTITKTDTIIKPHSFAFKGGLFIGGNKTQLSEISASIGLEIKNKEYLYKYNIQDNTHHIGVLINIWSK